WVPNTVALNPGDYFQMDINVNGYVTLKVNGTQKASFQGSASDYNFTYSSLNVKTIADIKLTASAVNGVACGQLDTDGDGIPNFKDLDSDGDGCNDAVEAGSAPVGTSVPLTGPVGNNGLVNTKETTTDNGVINYNLNYQNAISSSLKGCLDSDGDGVSDLNDIDDDNDGVPDFTELKSCPDLSGTFPFTYIAAGVVVPTFTANSSNNSYNLSLTSNNANWNSSYSNYSFSLPIHFEFKTNTAGTEAMIGFIPNFATKSVLNSYDDDSYKFYFSGASYYGYMPGAWNPSATTYASTDIFEYDISVNGVLTVKRNGVVARTVNVPISDYNFVLSCAGATTRTFTDLKIISGGVKNGNAAIT
ncbi:MAG: hypothetical protein EBZ95_15700, partial [Chitinophagia bacterium]|nr:hypothetical protein [Chitinophagia bacterium]